MSCDSRLPICCSGDLCPVNSLTLKTHILTHLPTHSEARPCLLCPASSALPTSLLLGPMLPLSQVHCLLPFLLLLVPPVSSLPPFPLHLPQLPLPAPTFFHLFLSLLLPFPALPTPLSAVSVPLPSHLSSLFSYLDPCVVSHILLLSGIHLPRVSVCVLACVHTCAEGDKLQRGAKRQFRFSSVGFIQAWDGKVTLQPQQTVRSLLEHLKQ